MKGSLHLIVNDNVTIKSNYITLIQANNNYRLYLIESIKGDSVRIKDIFSKEVHDVASNAVRNCVKFIANCEVTTYPVIYSDITSILDKYSKSLNEEEIQKFINDLVKGEGIKNVYGFEKKVYTKIIPKDAVEITSLFFIDKFKLHNTSDRLFVVDMIEHLSTRGGKDRMYELSNNEGLEIKCKRFDFKPIDKLNYKKLFTINETKH